MQEARRPRTIAGRLLERRTAHRPSATSGHLLECRRHAAPARPCAACSNAGRRHAAAEQTRTAIASRAAPCHQCPYTVMPSSADSSPPQKTQRHEPLGGKSSHTGPCLVRRQEAGPNKPATNRTCSLHDTTSQAAPVPARVPARMCVFSLGTPPSITSTSTQHCSATAIQSHAQLAY